MNRIVINGKTIRCNGSNVTIQNNRVIVDGKVISTNAIEQSDVTIYGDVENIKCEGSASCDNVKGNINAEGSVSCDDVGGNIECGGSVHCDSIAGDVKAGGSISM